MFSHRLHSHRRSLNSLKMLQSSSFDHFPTHHHTTLLIRVNFPMLQIFHDTNKKKVLDELEYVKAAKMTVAGLEPATFSEALRAL